MSDVPAFDDEHLETDLTIPESEDEVTFPDVYVGLEIGLLAPGDGIVTDRHHASGERYRPDDPLNQTEGQLTPFQMSGWLRHGCERVLEGAGATACHPGEPNAEPLLAAHPELVTEIVDDRRGNGGGESTRCATF